MLSVVQEYCAKKDLIGEPKDVLETIRDAMMVITEGTMVSVKVAIAKKKLDKAKAKKILETATDNLELCEKEFNIKVPVLPFLQQDAFHLILA